MLTAVEARLEKWARSDKDQSPLGYPKETVLSRIARHGTPIQGTRRPHFDELLDFDREIEETEEAIHSLPLDLRNPLKMYYLGRVDPQKPRLRVARNQAEELGLPVRTFYDYVREGKIWLSGWFQARIRLNLKNPCAQTIA